MGTGNYLHKSLRLLIALVGALFIVLYGRLNEIDTALVTPGFYIVLIISYGVALLIIFFTNYAWERFSRQPNLHISTIMKLIFIGFLMPLLFDFSCMSLYYAAIGQNVLNNGFLEYDFIVVVFLVLSLNAIYIPLAILKSKANSSQHKLHESAQTSSDPIQGGMPPSRVCLTENELYFTINYKGTNIRLRQADIIFIQSVGRKVSIHTAGRGTYQSYEPIITIEQKLNNKAFCKIAKGVIIHLKVVEGFQKGASKNTLQLVINEKHEHFFAQIQPDKLIVKKVFVAAFNDAISRFRAEN